MTKDEEVDDIIVDDEVWCPSVHYADSDPDVIYSEKMYN